MIRLTCFDEQNKIIVSRSTCLAQDTPLKDLVERCQEETLHIECPYDILNAVVQYHITGVVPQPFGMYTTNPLLWQHWFRYWDLPKPKQSKEQKERFLVYFKKTDAISWPDTFRVSDVEEFIIQEWNLLVTKSASMLVVPLLRHREQNRLQCLDCNNQLQYFASNEDLEPFSSKIPRHKTLFDSYVSSIRNRDLELEKLFLSFHP